MDEKIRNQAGKNAGLTLVELIVTFALIGIFMVSATFVLGNSLRMFQRMESTSKAVTVSDLLLDKISGEIAAADVDRNGKHDGYYFWLGEGADDPAVGADWIAFENRSGSPVSIYQENGKLVMKYYKITDADKVNPSVKPVQEINWKFDENVYMGYQIDKLTFCLPQPDEHPNVVRIDLSLKHERTGFAYSTYRYAENYNYDGSSKRLGLRSDSDGKTERPSEAVDFTYPAEWEPEEPTGPTEPEENVVDYRIIYIDMETGSEFVPEGVPLSGQAVSGTVVRVEPPEISGYVYNPEASEQNELGQVIDEINNIVRLYYERGAMYLYRIRGYVNYKDYPVTAKDPDYAGSGWSSRWELFEEFRSAPLSDHGKAKGVSPVIEGYICEENPYTIKVASTHTELVDIPYRPQEVTVTIYTEYGSTVDETTLTGYYDSTIGLHNNKKIPGFICNTTYAQIQVDKLSGIEYTFKYVRDWSQVDAPFPPQGPVIEIEPSTEENPDLAELVQKVAEEFSDFFLEGWSVLKEGDDEIGYRTFTGKDGNTYVIVGCCNLDNTHKVSQYKEQIEDATGVDRNNFIYLTDADDGIKNEKEMNWLWISLISQMDGLTPQEKELLLTCDGQELEFKKITNHDGNIQFVLEEVSFDFPDDTDAKAIYKKSN